MTDQEARLLRAEADTYRKAIVALVCDATSGKRTTIDKERVAEIAGRALDEGNEWSRRIKAETS